MPPRREQAAQPNQHNQQHQQQNVAAATRVLWSAYTKDTPVSLKMIDIYLVYIMLSGILQFVYMLMAGTYPYNAFLAGFISTVGSFVLAGTYRINPVYS